MKALLVGADQGLRDQMRVQSLLRLARRCSQLAPVSGLHAALASLGRRWLLLHDEVLELDRAIRDLVRRTVPQLIERSGVGIHSAAQLLITAGGNPDRLRCTLWCQPRPSQQRPTTAPSTQPTRRPPAQ